jgi:hypothetical protein
MRIGGKKWTIGARSVRGGGGREKGRGDVNAARGRRGGDLAEEWKGWGERGVEGGWGRVPGGSRGVKREGGGTGGEGRGGDTERGEDGRERGT